MKKLFLLALVSIIVLIGSLHLAYAQEEEISLPNAGITPESPFYFLDRIGEAIQEFLTFNPGAKARLQVAFAAERIAEIKVVLETKGVGARGLDIAQARLEAHAAKAADIVKEEKQKGREVSALAGEIVDNFHIQRKAVKQIFEGAKDTFEVGKEELKEALRAAIEAGDTEAQERIRLELAQIEADKDEAEVKKDAAIDALEAEKERLQEELEEKKLEEEVQREISKVEEEKQEVLDEAVEEGVVLPAAAFADFDQLLLQAENALQVGNHREALGFIKQAERSLEQADDLIDELDKKKELKEEAEEAIREAEEELALVRAEAEEEGVTLPGEAFSEFNSLLTQAKNALALENFKEAKRLAKQAEDALEDVEKTIEELEKEKEKQEEAAKEEEERIEKKEEKKREEAKKAEEQLKEEQEKIKEEMKEEEKKVEEQKEAEEEQEKVEPVSTPAPAEVKTIVTVEPAQEPEPQKATVTLTQGGFSPSRITIQAGEEITFANDSGRTMWVASNIHPTHTLYSGFDQLRSVGDGGTYTFTFTREGTWRYHNHVNPGEGGTVVVE